jgi:hypothetical protein
MNPNENRISRCFNVKEVEEGRGRGMSIGRTNKRVWKYIRENAWKKIRVRKFM